MKSWAIVLTTTLLALSLPYAEAEELTWQVPYWTTNDTGLTTAVLEQDGVTWIAARVYQGTGHNVMANHVALPWGGGGSAYWRYYDGTQDARYQPDSLVGHGADTRQMFGTHSRKATMLMEVQAGGTYSLRGYLDGQSQGSGTTGYLLIRHFAYNGSGWDDAVTIWSKTATGGNNPSLDTDFNTIDELKQFQLEEQDRLGILIRTSTHSHNEYMEFNSQPSNPVRLVRVIKGTMLILR